MTVAPERRVHLVVYGVALTLALVAIPLLSVVGVQALLDSRDGEVIDPVLDPLQPGYQALVSPSPTLAVLHLDPDGSLVGAAMLALAGEDDPAAGGSVVLLPASTAVDLGDLGVLPLSFIHSFDGTDSTKAQMEQALGLGIDDVAEMDHDVWADLVAPFDGLRIQNPDEVITPEGVRFAPGPLTLEPDEVGAYLAALGEGENPLNRMLRQELVWDAYLETLGSDPEAVSFPGEQGEGLARFLPVVASGPHRVEVIPLIGDGLAVDDEPVFFLPDDEAVAALVPELVPFPAGARPGDRPLVRLLDGSGRAELLVDAVGRVAVAGGQVVIVGNADSFDVAETEIRYAEPAYEPTARAVAEQLGVGNLVRIDHIDDNAELVVVLGADYSG